MQPLYFSLAAILLFSTPTTADENPYGSPFDRTLEETSTWGTSTFPGPDDVRTQYELPLEAAISTAYDQCLKEDLIPDESCQEKMHSMYEQVMAVHLATLIKYKISHLVSIKRGELSGFVTKKEKEYISELIMSVCRAQNISVCDMVSN